MTFGVIVAGRAVVSVHGRPARTLGPGEYFGEMALIHYSRAVGGGASRPRPWHCC